MVTLGCVLFVLLVSVIPATAAVVRQPYLQLVTPTSVTVVWRTDLNSADNSRVQYGTVSGTLNQTATNTAVTRSGLNVKDHIVTIAGLSAATKYFYNVGTVTNGVQGGGTNQHFFVTAPPTGSSTPFRAWVLGDSGFGSADQALVRDAMLTETTLNPPSPNLILHMGDIAYNNGTDAEFTTKHFAMYQNILRYTPLWPTLGNHESPSVNTSLGIGPYYEAHVLPANGQAGGVASGTEAFYAFDYANAHFIVLDSMDSSRAIGSPMVTWLQNDLAATGQEWVIAYWHHPPYTKGTHNSDSASDSGGRMIDMRETILPILEAGGVDLVIAGHSHAYERSYLIDGAYGYAPGPNFVTPPFNTLLTDGHILDAKDGNPAGQGAYQKHSGGNSNDGAVYVVSGHGGSDLGGTGGHPVMLRFDPNFGSVLLDVNGSTLTVRNLQAGGLINDTFAIQRSPTGITVTPTAGLGTTEAGGTAAFTVALNTLPTANVTIGLTSNDTTEGTVSPTSLTFTPANGTTPQTVTVTGVDDALLDGNIPYTIITAPATSADSNYNGQNAPDVSVTNIDNEAPPPVPGVAWSAVNQGPSGSWTDSSWDLRSFRILLKGSVITASGSTVQLTLKGRSSGNYTLQRVSLVRREGGTLNGVDSTNRQVTFGSTWNAGVTVPAGSSVTSDPIPYDLLAGQDVFVTFWAPAGSPPIARTGGTSTSMWMIENVDQSATIDWAGLTISGTRAYTYCVELLEVIPSGGPPGITVTPTTGQTTTEAGGTATFTVALNTLPTANVTIGLTSNDTTEGTVSPTSLTFTPSNGTTPQTVTVTGVNDALLDGNIPYTIITAPATGADPNYNGLNAPDVSVTNTDNEAPPPVPGVAWSAVNQGPSGSWTDSSWDLRSFRILLKGSVITASGSTVQLTLKGRSSGNYTLQRVSLVRREGGTLNGVDSTNRQVTFGSTWNAGVTVPAGGSVTSDPLPYDLLAGQDVFVTFWAPAGSPPSPGPGGPVRPCG